MKQEAAVDVVATSSFDAPEASVSEAVARPVPRVKEAPVIGSTIRFQSDQIGFVTGLQREYPDVVKARIVHEDWYFVFNPEIVHEANVRQWSKFHKPAIAKMIWKIFLGNGLVPNDGEHWRRQHDLIKPGFHRQRIDAYAPSMVEATSDALARYREGEVRDVREDINNIALAIVGKTLFGADMSDSTSTVYKAMHSVSEMLVEHINMPLPTPRWWPGRGNRRKIAAIEAIESVIKRLIAERKASGVDGGDVLSHIVFTKDDRGVGMTNTEMRDEAMTLIFAGHETTAHNMTWTWYLLATHPEVAARAYAEIQEVAGDRPLTLEDTDKLVYLSKVIKESLRFMPAVWTYMRSPIEDVVLGGYFFPKGSTLFISQYALNRDPRWHPAPLVFNPDRWTREYERGLPKGAYVPFAAGPRVCLGQGFAQMEMKLVLGTMLQKLVPALEPGFEPNLVPELSLHPGPRGMKILVKRRDAAAQRGNEASGSER